MRKVKLWVDDVREAPPGWVRSYNSKEAIDFLKGFWEEVEDVSLDHDLGGEDTGMKVLIFIEYMVAIEQYPAPIITIHSWNPVGRERMESAIQSIYAFDRQNQTG
jgi:hypothetical protein